MISVLFGGISAEHDVSCVSAYHVAINLVDTIQLIGIDRKGNWFLLDDTEQIDNGAGKLMVDGTPITPNYLLENSSTVFPVLHGPGGEDGTIQGLCETLGVPYVGCRAAASAVLMSKYYSKMIADGANLPQADWTYLNKASGLPSSRKIAEIFGKLGETVFVKPANMGSSIGITKATRDNIQKAVALAFAFDDVVVIEKAVTAREIEVAALQTPNGWVYSEPGEILPGDEWYSYEDKYENGVSQTKIPALLDNEIKAKINTLNQRVVDIYGITGLARIDYFLVGNEVLLNEVNTMPGFTPISMYPKLMEHAGYSYPELLKVLVETAK